MPYKGSYIWKIRQKIGHDLLIVSSADTIVVRNDGKILLCYSLDFDGWTTPGGSVEPGKTWRESALAELIEEAGISAKIEDFIPYAASSGNDWGSLYKNGDKLLGFSLAFILTEWTEISNSIDASEVTKKQFFSLDEIEDLRLSKFAKPLIDAYKRYSETGAFQMIDLIKKEDDAR